MRSVYVSFSKVMDVKRFIEKISPLDGNFDLIDGMYIVDAKSLMGILAMDLTKPIQLRIERDSEKTLEAIEDFTVDAPVGAVCEAGAEAGSIAGAGLNSGALTDTVNSGKPRVI